MPVVAKGTFNALIDAEIVVPRLETLFTISPKLFVIPLQITLPAFNASLNRVLDASFKIPAMLEIKLCAYAFT